MQEAGWPQAEAQFSLEPDFAPAILEMLEMLKTLMTSEDGWWRLKVVLVPPPSNLSEPPKKNVLGNNKIRLSEK